VRLAVIATAATVAGLVALLGYKSGGALDTSTAGRAGPPVTTPAGGAAPSPGPTSGGTEYTGTDVEYRYGDLEVRIAISGGRITALTFPEESATDPRSQEINSAALPILTQEAIAAQGLHFDAVSGATFTSDAFAQSLQSALDQAGR
jgi:uncharacterized protein with FMN-binding domain